MKKEKVGKSYRTIEKAEEEALWARGKMENAHEILI